jgi:hypothetical protein
MSTYTAAEATKFFRSYCVKCDENEIKEWMENTPTINRGNQVDECDLYAFNDWLRCKGTSYEPGIDDQTRIARMIEEIAELRKENEALRTEMYKLATDPEYMPL